jgi:tetratricopeptide (TPR) repeat protein
MTTAAGNVSGLQVRAPLVGRAKELAELDDALARALSSNEPQIVTIVGSAGVGKTRLVDEVFTRIAGRERRVRCYRGAAREGGPAYEPIARVLRARFSLPEQAEEEGLRDKLRQQVTEALGDRRVTEFLHFLGAFLELAFPESPFIKAVEDDPEQFARISRAVLRRFLEVDAHAHPIVVAFEDLQWASDDALDLVKSLIDSAREAPLVILTTGRPELLTRRPGWLDGPASWHHARIELAPLSSSDAEQLMLRLLAPVGDPPGELVDAAVDMAGGNPYLLEQMLRTYVESGTLIPRANGQWEVDLDRLDDAQLPLSVDDAIAARIASLGPAERQLLEMAAIMGGVFWLGALVALGRIDKKAPALWGGAEDLGAQYRDLLNGLIDRDYVLAMPDASMPGETEYAFKHNLERETLYKLMSAAQLKRFHLTFAEWLEMQSRLESGPAAGRAGTEEHYEMLAQHYERGGAPRKAAEFYVLAGDRARERYANGKAQGYYERGIELLGEEDLRRRIEALHNLGDVLQLVGKNEEAIAVFRTMQELAYRLDLKAKGGVAHNRIGRVYRAIGQLDEAMRHLGTGHALFDAAGDVRGVASSLDDVGKVHWMRGAYEAAERFMKRSLELRREIGDRRSIALSLNNLGLVYQDSGRFEESLAAWDEALTIRREIHDHPGIAQTLNNLGSLHQDRGEHPRATELWRDALEVNRVVGDRMREAVILTNLGEAAYRMQKPEEAISVLRQAEQLSSTLGDRILEGEILRGLAKAHMMTGDIASARDLIKRSIALFEQAKGKPFLGVALRTAGEIAAAGGWGGEGHAQAKEQLEQSIRLFEELGNDPELARSCIALAAFLESDPESSSDPIRAHEINRLRSRADAILSRQGTGEHQLTDHDPLADATDPGI